MYIPVRLAFAVAIALSSIATAAAGPAGIPNDAICVSPCVAHMGEHWANPHVLSHGPIYGVMHGKPVFTEIMIDKNAFGKGLYDHDQLKPLPGYAIDHVDIDFQPHGHPGFPIPHYDIHAYYVSHAKHMEFCPTATM